VASSLALAPGGDADLLFTLPDALLDHTLNLVDVSDLARMQELSSSWRARLAALRLLAARFAAARIEARMCSAFAAEGVLPNIMRHLEDGEDAHAQLAKTRLVSKTWFDAASATFTIELVYSTHEALASSAAMAAAPLGQPLVLIPHAPMSWLQ
jgi:hypothetical protein